MAKLTMEEMTEIIRASLKAAHEGNYEEERRLLRMLPLSPHLAWRAKRFMALNT